MNGIINAYKPSGISSAAAVGKIRHALGYRHVGHMGTLDPIGEGVLLVGIGKGARLFDYYLGKSKTYEATFKFGISSDTLDIAGNITDQYKQYTRCFVYIGCVEFFGGKTGTTASFIQREIGRRRSCLRACEKGNCRRTEILGHNGELV